ncbi:MAG: hypothetical protein FJX45_18485 [Alphaproteobacteria bacterium]|nr:hypothetical protein [Alphaproteobacteria bacterium]
MPMPSCHSLSSIIGGMFQSTSDKVALAASGVASAPLLLQGHLKDANEFVVFVAPTLASVFLALKIILVIPQILAEWRRFLSKWWRKE